MTLRLLAAALAVAMSAPAIAHEKFKIVGSVVKVLAEEIHVKAVDGATYEMDFPDNAPVMRKLKKVSRAELKPGVKVIVNALGHDFFDLEVVEVQLVD